MPTLTEKRDLARAIGADHEYYEINTAIERQKLDEVMNGMPYYEVTDDDLEHLFRIDKHNEILFFVALVLPPVLCGILSWIVCTHMSVPGRWIALAAVNVLGLVFGWAGFYSIAESISMVLKKENLNATRIRIPYGAMLRVKEAMDTKLFDSFQIVFPAKFEKPIMADPAIVGKRKDGKEMMIVYWDIEKDIEHVMKEIRKSFPLKLS